MSLKSLAFRLCHKREVLILLELNDGRLVVYSDDKIIYVYKKSLTIDYRIKNINSVIKSMIQTKDEKLICCSYEITILKLNLSDYEIVQIIKAWTNKIIEIKESQENNNYINNLLASQNNYIRIYGLNKGQNSYKLNYEYDFGQNINNIIYLKNNDYAILLDDYFKNIYLKIFDLKQRKIKESLYQIKAKESGEMCLIENKYLIVSLYLCLILVDIGPYQILHLIKTSFGCVNSFCYLKNNIFLSGDDVGDVVEWKIEKNKLIKIKEYNANKKEVRSVIKYNKTPWIVYCSNNGIIIFYETNL